MMSDEKEKDEIPLDHETIARFSIPDDSRIPDPLTGLSTQEEYDQYFRFLRDNPRLREWTLACIRLHDEQLKQIMQSSLTEGEKCEILQGMLIVQHITLKKWASACVTSGEATQDRLTTCQRDGNSNMNAS